MTEFIKLQENKGWPVIRRANSRSRAPWGYVRNPDDKFEFLPDERLVMFAEKAMDFLDQGNSLRETADWLYAQSGTSISHTALSMMWKRNRGDKNTARTKKLKGYKKKAKARTKAEKDAYQLARMESTLKRQATMLAKKKAKLNGEHSARDGPPEATDTTEEPQETEFLARDPDSELNQEIIFQPNDGPQYEFLAATEKVCLFGGSAGGKVKSYHRCLF